MIRIRGNVSYKTNDIELSSDLEALQTCDRLLWLRIYLSRRFDV